MYTEFMYTLVFGYGCVQIHRSAMPKKIKRYTGE